MTEIKENIFRVDAKRGSHIYYIKADKGVLIDCGHPFDADENLEILKKNHISPDMLSYIILTHSHFDHIGGTSLFLSYFNSALVIASDFMADNISLRKKINLLPELECYVEPYEIDINISQPLQLDLGNENCNIFKTPGHCRDGLSLSCRDNSIVFTGDTLYKSMISQVDYNYDLYTSFAELEDSHEIFRNFGDSLFIPGHGFPFVMTDKDWILCSKKMERFKKRPDLFVINNIVPVVEFFLDRNPGIEREEAFNTLSGYLERPLTRGIISTYKKEDIHDILEKALLLMNTLGMIENKDGFIFLTSNLNSHL